MYPRPGLAVIPLEPKQGPGKRNSGSAFYKEVLGVQVAWLVTCPAEQETWSGKSWAGRASQGLLGHSDPAQGSEVPSASAQEPALCGGESPAGSSALQPLSTRGFVNEPMASKELKTRQSGGAQPGKPGQGHRTRPSTTDTPSPHLSMSPPLSRGWPWPQSATHQEWRSSAETHLVTMGEHPRPGRYPHVCRPALCQKEAALGRLEATSLHSSSSSSNACPN